MQKLEESFEVTCNQEDRVLSKDEIITSLNGKDALLCLLTDTIDGDIMDASDKLKVISNYAVGFNNIDLDAANARELPVCNTPGVLTESTADLTWALLLGIGRRVVEGDVFTRTGQFHGWGPLMLLGADFHSRTLGIVGMGRIGQAVARRAEGFGMRVLYSGNSAKQDVYGTFTDLETVLQESDFVSLHCPYNESTHHLIGSEQIAMMKRTAYIINTARGPIIDEAALYKALKERSIAGAGLDVYEEEPKLYPGLTELDNTILLPHLGSATIETRTRMGLMAAENAAAILAGQQPHSMANPGVLS